MKSTNEYLAARPVEKKIQMHLKLSQTNMNEVKRLSKKHKLSMTEIIERALAYFFDAHKKGE